MNEPTLSSLESAPERAINAIREMILSGRISSGQKINQRAISKELELTTAPTREALSVLMAEGLLEKLPGIGIFCKAYTVDEIEELVEIRWQLETLAARRACLRITPEQKELLQKEARGLSEPSQFKSKEEYTLAHIGFHRLIVDIADSRHLTSLLHKNYAIQQMLANINADVWPIEPNAHALIAEAISRGKPDDAEHAIRQSVVAIFKDRLTRLKLEYGSNPILGPM